MSLGTVLDVAFGLALVFVLVSTIASAIQEIIATVLSTRGKVLRDMVYQMLHDQPPAAPPPAPAPVAGAAAPASLGDLVFGHPLIAGLSTRNLPAWFDRLVGGAQLPSYIPAGNFSSALVETLRKGHDDTLAIGSQVERAIALMSDDSPVKQTLQAFMVEAKGDMDAFRARLQTWYDDAMDRAAGVYKRFAQYTLLIIGLLLALVINIDVLRIGNTLWYDRDARAAVDKAATAYLASHHPPATAATTTTAPPPATDSNAAAPPADSIGDLKQRIDDSGQLLATLPLPIGWTGAGASGPTSQDIAARGAFCAWLLLIVGKIVGFLLTAFAVSLGAPFWFDMLQNVANLRGAGPVPDRAPSGDIPGGKPPAA